MRLSLSEFLALSDKQKAELTELSLAGEKLGDLTLDKIETFCAELSKCHALQDLHLYGNRLGYLNIVGWQALEIAFSQLHALHTITLDGNDLNNLNLEGLKAFGNALSKLRALHSLNLEVNKLYLLSAAQWQAFGTAISQLHTLGTLNLWGNYLYFLSANSWQGFANAIHPLRTLHTLNLGDNSLGDVFTTDPWQNLRVLLPKLPELQTLCLSKNCLNCTFATEWKDLGTLLSQCRTLHTLDLKFNKLNNLNIAVFNTALLQLQGLKTLHTLDLSQNSIDSLDEEHAQALENFARQSPELHTLILHEHNPFNTNRFTDICDERAKNKAVSLGEKFALLQTLLIHEKNKKKKTEAQTESTGEVLPRSITMLIGCYAMKMLKKDDPTHALFKNQLKIPNSLGSL